MTKDRPGMLSDEDSIHVDEATYERVAWEAFDECGNLTPPYYPSIWIGMVRQRGAAEAARHLLANGVLQGAFGQLRRSQAWALCGVGTGSSGSS